jgi:hypothetical protein
VFSKVEPLRLDESMTSTELRGSRISDAELDKAIRNRSQGIDPPTGGLTPMTRPAPIPGGVFRKSNPTMLDADMTRNDGRADGRRRAHSLPPAHSANEGIQK